MIRSLSTIILGQRDGCSTTSTFFNWFDTGIMLTPPSRLQDISARPAAGPPARCHQRSDRYVPSPLIRRHIHGYAPAYRRPRYVSALLSP